MSLKGASKSFVLRRVVSLTPLVLLFGCQAMAPKVDIADTSPVLPQAVVAPPVNNGAIFQGASYRPLFEDHRARLVGDTITVQIVEKVTATQKSTSSIDKSGGLAAGVTAIPGIAANSFTPARATLGATSSNTLAGKGST